MPKVIHIDINKLCDHCLARIPRDLDEEYFQILNAKTENVINRPVTIEDLKESFAVVVDDR